VSLTQRISESVHAQFGRPTAFGGHAAGLLMAYRSSNRKRNAWAVSLMDVQPRHRVLEIGFGPGVAIHELSRLAYEGYVCGVDHSPVMLSQARRRNADGIRRGVVELRLGSVEDLPDFDRPFDRILAVNTVLFWREPEARFRELRQLLRQGGSIAVVHQPRGPGACDEGSFAWGRATAEALGTAGFSDVRMETLRLQPAVTCVLGSNGARP
jgi:SAM-dependent methyltransferase